MRPSNRRLLILAASLTLALGAASSQSQTPAQPGATPPAKNLLTVKEVMHHIVNPAAEIYWKAAGEVDTAEGEQHRVPTPEDDARWNATLDAAATLQEGGNLLMLPGRARDNGKWMQYAQQLSDAGALAIAAAKARDEKKTFDAGSALYDACFNCHGRYIPRPANSLYKHLNEPDSDFKPPM